MMWVPAGTETVEYGSTLRLSTKTISQSGRQRMVSCAGSLACAEEAATGAADATVIGVGVWSALAAAPAGLSPAARSSDGADAAAVALGSASAGSVLVVLSVVPRKRRMAAKATPARPRPVAKTTGTLREKNRLDGGDDSMGAG